MGKDEQDTQVLREWVDQHQTAVYRAAVLILHDPEAAGDVAQETFLRAFLAVGRVPPTAAIRPWLYRIAVNLSLNRLRSRRREARALERAVQGPQDPDGVEDLWERRASRLTVAQAVGRLPDRLRVTVVLRYYLDLSEGEMARLLGVRPGTVKSRLQTAAGSFAAGVASAFRLPPPCLNCRQSSSEVERHENPPSVLGFSHNCSRRRGTCRRARMGTTHGAVGAWGPGALVHFNA